MVSGGSLLGDRARMGALAGDEGVFIRSYATAGDPGGVTSTVYASMEVLAAAYDVVLVETVGVGQTETDVRTVVDSVALVLQPGSGDTIQFLKAGIMEIPDLFVVQESFINIFDIQTQGWRHDVKPAPWVEPLLQVGEGCNVSIAHHKKLAVQNCITPELFCKLWKAGRDVVATARE